MNARCAHPKRDKKPQQELGGAFAYSSGTTDGICLYAFRVRGYAGQFACADRLRSVGDPHPTGKWLNYAGRLPNVNFVARPGKPIANPYKE